MPPDSEDTHVRVLGGDSALLRCRQVHAALPHQAAPRHARRRRSRFTRRRVRISAHALNLGMARSVPAFHMLSAGLHARCRVMLTVMLHILRQSPIISFAVSISAATRVLDIPRLQHEWNRGMYKDTLQTLCGPSGTGAFSLKYAFRV